MKLARKADRLAKKTKAFVYAWPTYSTWIISPELPLFGKDHYVRFSGNGTGEEIKDGILRRTGDIK